ncbi:actin-3-like [Oncorhynchus tshawytscha]|uniref:actin-3-like n=1 Tax=Oncorhynchus tshawytscha TaxID=74940 RepID=UPI000D0A3088|nr:actin-3-like [Oncorhynchus tshawytscha]
MDNDTFVDPILPSEGPAKVAKLIRVNEGNSQEKKKSSKSKNTSPDNPKLKKTSKSSKPKTELDEEESSPKAKGIVKYTKAVVIDVGTGYLKTGFAGADAPSCVIPSVVGLARKGPLDYKHGYVGREILETLDISHVSPVHNGIVTEWDAMERLWEYSFKTLGIPSEEHAVLLCDPPLSPTTNREKLAEIMFESFSTPAMFIENQSVLSMYSYGRTSGLVLECGHGCSYAVPIDDGHYIPSYTCRAEYAGRSLDLYLQKLLQESGKGFSFDKLGLMDDIKAKCCYVAPDIDIELRVCDMVQYKLPDGNYISLGNERSLCPEVLFQPNLIGSLEPGLPIMVMNCINKCDIRLKSDMLQNILICGGSTMFSGLPERLQSELNQIAPCGGTTIVASQERQNTVWLGGSILASLSSFQSLWIRRKDYEEKGPFVIYRKCF